MGGLDTVEQRIREKLYFFYKPFIICFVSISSVLCSEYIDCAPNHYLLIGPQVLFGKIISTFYKHFLE